MHRLGFLARIAFICNMFFAICLLLQYQGMPLGGSLVSMAAILGLVLGPVLANPASNLLNGIMLLRKQPVFTFVPRWLAAVNLMFLILQFFYLLHIWS